MTTHWTKRGGIATLSVISCCLAGLGGKSATAQTRGAVSSYDTYPGVSAREGAGSINGMGTDPAFSAILGEGMEMTSNGLGGRGPSGMELPTPINPSLAVRGGGYARSGLISRFTQPPRPLPPDRDRDVFTGTKYVDRNVRPPLHPNLPWRGGLYGELLPTECAQCYDGYFRGDPGSSFGTQPPCRTSRPLTRMYHSIFKPFKPVGYYYAGGCHVPIYDLDAWTIGPGTFPYPYKFDHLRGG